MAVSIMQRLELITMRDNASELMHRLTWLSCVEVQSKLPKGGEGALEKASFDAEKAESQKRLQILEKALEALKKHGKSKRGLLSGKIAIEKSRLDTDAARPGLALAKQACDLAQTVQDASAAITQDEELMSGLDVWKDHDLPLSSSGTDDVDLQLGYFPADTSLEDVCEKLASLPPLYEFEQVASDKRGVFVAAYNHNSISKKFNRLLTDCGFTHLDFRDIKVTASEEISNCKARIENNLQKCETALAELAEIGKKRSEIEIAYDAEKLTFDKIEAKQKFFCTKHTVYMTAWVPRKAVKAVETALRGLDCWYEFSDPAPDDDVPTALDNKSFAKPFEGVVEMYSMPKYLSFDPTLIMSIFYFVIFGLMMADVGYGLELVFFGWFLLKKMKPTGGARNLLTMITICGVSSVIMGVLFGSYFGDLPVAIMTNLLGKEPVNLALLFDIVKEPMNFLFISLGVGALHLFTGMAIRFYVLCKRGKPLDAIFDVGSWYVLFAGIGMLVVIPSVGKWVAIAGVAMLILTQGRAEKNIVMKFFKGLISLYDLISYMSDLLSYSRIMAMGLASAVIASVFNILGTMGGVIGVLAMVLIGHTLNLAIGVLGTYVHNCRLQFIEFFGKFYEDGGRAFRPVRPDLKYTEIIDSNKK